MMMVMLVLSLSPKMFSTRLSPKGPTTLLGVTPTPLDPCFILRIYFKEN
jgi:hypothetical protein